MTAEQRRELIQDLRAHAHEAPEICSALMRRAATMLEAPAVPLPLYHDPRPQERHRQVKGAACN